MKRNNGGILALIGLGAVVAAISKPKISTGTAPEYPPGTTPPAEEPKFELPISPPAEPTPPGTPGVSYPSPATNFIPGDIIEAKYNPNIKITISGVDVARSKYQGYSSSFGTPNGYYPDMEMVTLNADYKKVGRLSL